MSLRIVLKRNTFQSSLWKQLEKSGVKHRVGRLLIKRNFTHLPREAGISQLNKMTFNNIKNHGAMLISLKRRHNPRKMLRMYTSFQYKIEKALIMFVIGANRTLLSGCNPSDER